MEDLKEVAKLILLQVDHDEYCGKAHEFTIDAIAGIIKRRVVNKIIEDIQSKL